ncbi:MAG: glycosyltransferase [Methylovulum sp.]|nr:glycosyltransferase [Methylovulum sp.]
MDKPLFSNRRSLAYITNIPTPYRVEMVEVWARLNPQLAISVFYTDQTDQGRGWNCGPIKGVSEHRLMNLGQLPKYGKINFGLLDLVRNHDVIMIGGFEEASYLISAVLSKVLGKPVILLFDGFSPARFDTEWFSVRWLKRITASFCNAFFANGEVSRRYLDQHLCVVRGKPIFNQYLSHSDYYISEARQQLTGLGKRDIQTRLGLVTERTVLLCCGYLIQRKRIDLVIEAISLLPEPSRPLLLIVGMGGLADILAQQAASGGVQTHFAGFKQQVELATYYFAADALVLASEDDPWGLVVNEAMSAGLPVIVSDACGAAFDLVREGQNGFVFPNRDAKALSRVIEQLLDSDLFALGATSRMMIQQWTAEHSARSLGRCLVAVVGEDAGIEPKDRLAGNSLSGTPEVLVLHERGGRKYMEAVCSLGDDMLIGQVDFVEASVFMKFVWDVFRQRRRLGTSVRRALINWRFRWSFRCLAGKTVIFGVAPWDYRFLLYQSVRECNRLIYHTSWPYWDGTFVPRKYGFLTPWLRKRWLTVLKQNNVEIVAVTEMAASSLGNLLPGKHITVIPHVVSPSFFEYRAKYANPFRLLFVGELSKDKGVFMLPALLDALEEYGCSLDIVGDGSARNFVQGQVQFRPNVTWHGHVADRERLADLMATSQVLVVPSVKSTSWEELFGMVITEAMAVGLPVVASQHVGPRSLVEDGVTGYLVPEGCVDDFAKRIAILMHDATAWQRFSDVSRERSRRYHLDSVKSGWRQLLLHESF